jgi:hypothetical protein
LVKPGDFFSFDQRRALRTWCGGCSSGFCGTCSWLPTAVMVSINAMESLSSARSHSQTVAAWSRTCGVKPRQPLRQPACRCWPARPVLRRIFLKAGGGGLGASASSLSGQRRLAAADDTSDHLSASVFSEDVVGRLGNSSTRSQCFLPGVAELVVRG